MAGGYKVMVRPYLFGQYRVQLIDLRRPSLGGPGTIVRELCTYSRSKAQKTVEMLCSAVDPEAACEALAKPWNCQAPGGRIRLDNPPVKPGDQGGRT